MDLYNSHINNLIVGSIFIFIIFFGIFYYWFLHERKDAEGEEESSRVGERYGNDTHVWQVIIDSNKHVVTLKAGLKDILILDGDVIESGYVMFSKDYNFQIDGELTLLTSRVSSQHGWVHRLFVSGKQVE